MSIQSSSFSLARSYQSMVRDQSSERLSTWSRVQPEADTKNAGSTSGNALARSPVSISAAARSALAADFKAAGEAANKALQTISADQSSAANSINSAFDSAESDPVVGLIKSMVEMMTGEAIKLFSARDFGAGGGQSVPPQLAPPAQAGSADDPSSPQAPLAGSGFAYDYRSLYEEYQEVKFSAEGLIKTSDGQEISFKIDLSMSRYYSEETSMSVRSGDAVREEPLVLNFDGPAAQLSDRHFDFDLFGKGKKDSLPLLQGNRGFLAFDRSGSGKIDGNAAFNWLSLLTHEERDDHKPQSLKEANKAGAVDLAV